MGPKLYSCMWRGHCTTLFNSTGKHWAGRPTTTQSPVKAFFCWCLRPILSILYTHKHTQTHTRQTHMYVTHTHTHAHPASASTPTPTQPPPVRLRNLATFVLATWRWVNSSLSWFWRPFRHRFTSSTSIIQVYLYGVRSHTHTRTHTHARLSRRCTVGLEIWASFFIYADNNKQQNCVSKHKRQISHLYFSKKKNRNQTV